MATANKDLANRKVQGPGRTERDPLDKIVAIAIRVAAREGLLSEPDTELAREDRTEPQSDGRRSA